MSLYEFYMESCTSDVLKEWVELCGGPGKLIRKADRAEFLVRTLTSPEELRRLWDALDDISRKAVASAYHNEGRFLADAFLAQYGSLPSRPRRSQYSLSTLPIPLDLFMQNNMILPPLMPLLAPLVGPPERFQLEGTEGEAPTIVLDGETVAPKTALREESGRRDLLALLSLANQGKLKLTSNARRLAPKSLALLRQHLADGDFAVDSGDADDSLLCFGLLVFAQEAELLTSAGTLTEAGRRYLATEDPSLLLDAFEHWSESGEFDAVTRIAAIRGLRARGLSLTPPAERNQRIVEALSWCPTGVWISLRDFYRAVKIWHFDFDIEQGGLDRLYVAGSGYSYNQYGGWASRQNRWLLTNGLYISAVLWETLAAIGALDIAYVEDAAGFFPGVAHYYDEEIYSRYDGLVSLRINPLGAYLFGQADVYGPAQALDAALFTLADDGHITLLPGASLSAAHHAQLAQIADEAGGGYRLSVPKLMALLETEKNLDIPRTFLEQRNRGPLPQAVLDLLSRAEEDRGAFQIQSRALIIRARSAADADAVLNDPAARKLVRRLDAETLLILDTRETALRNALNRLGYGLRGWQG